MGERRRPFELRDERHPRAMRLGDELARAVEVVGGLDEAERDHVHAEREAEREIVLVLRRDRRGRQRHAGRVDALVLAELAAVDDRRLNLPAVGRFDVQLDAAVGEQQAIAVVHAAREARERRRHAARTADEVARRDAQRVARLQRQRAAAFERAGADFGPPRSWRIATSRPARAAAARARA